MKTEHAPILNHGYYRFSKLLKPIRWGILLFLCVFTLILLVFFGEDMTASHFRYFLNNFDFSLNAEETAGEVLYYDADADASFGFVSGGFVTLTDSRVFVTDRSSTTTLSAYHGYRAPMGAYSDRYMVIYDRAGSSATVYNAFSALKSFSYEGTVLAADVSDSGVFAIATSNVGQYYTKVYLYDEDFTLIRTVSKYKYFTAFALDESGEYLYLASRYTEGAELLYELQIIDLDKGEAIATEVLDFPIYKIKLEKNKALLLSSDGFYTYSGGMLVKEADLGEAYKSGLLENGAYFVTTDADYRKEMFHYCFDGGVLKKSLSSPLKSCLSDGKYLYLLCERAFFVLDRASGELYDVSGSCDFTDTLSLVSAKDSVYLAGSFRADRLNGDELIVNFGK